MHSRIALLGTLDEGDEGDHEDGEENETAGGNTGERLEIGNINNTTTGGNSGGNSKRNPKTSKELSPTDDVVDSLVESVLAEVDGVGVGAVVSAKVGAGNSNSNTTGSRSDDVDGVKSGKKENREANQNAEEPKLPKAVIKEEKLNVNEVTGTLTANDYATVSANSSSSAKTGLRPPVAPAPPAPPLAAVPPQSGGRLNSRGGLSRSNSIKPNVSETGTIGGSGIVQNTLAETLLELGFGSPSSSRPMSGGSNRENLNGKKTQGNQDSDNNNAALNVDNNSSSPPPFSQTQQVQQFQIQGQQGQIQNPQQTSSQQPSATYPLNASHQSFPKNSVRLIRGNSLIIRGNHASLDRNNQHDMPTTLSSASNTASNANNANSSRRSVSQPAADRSRSYSTVVKSRSRGPGNSKKGLPSGTIHRNDLQKCVASAFLQASPFGIEAQEDVS
jgi:hypothetical protein